MKAEELQSGKLYWLRNGEVICDKCGTEMIWDNLPVEFIGLYEDERKTPFVLFRHCFWVRCSGCCGFVDTTRIFYNGIPADKFSLFAKVAHDHH